MDQKTWLWRKKSTDKVNASSKGHEDEIHKLSSEKAELETDLRDLNDKLSDAISELYAKDDLIKKHEKMARDAMEGWENAEAKALSLKQELDESFQDRIAGEERMAHLDAALKECMQQLQFVRDEQEQRIHDAVMKTSQEFERSQLILEEKLKDTSTVVARLSAENTQLSKALLAKEKTIEDLSKQKARLETDFNFLVTKSEATEKDNASLKYEVRVLEKEVEIRNEEREFNRRTADASHKQHLESVKKIAKLESECQRLRLLVRKRLPGPAALAKMKNEVEILGRDAVDARRRRSNSNPSGLTLDYTTDNFPDAKKINFLTEQLCATEEENKSLKEALNKKANELQFSRTMYARTASKLSQVESHVDDMSKGQAILESSAGGLVSHEVPLASISDIGSDDKASCAESWASALISELEVFKSGKLRGSPSSRTVGASDINLMDDFVEMERLAIVSVDKQSGSPCTSSVDTNALVGPLEADLNGYSSDVTGKEIVPVSESGSGTFNQEIKSKDIVTDKAPSWLQGIVKVIWEQHRVTLRQPDEILEDVRLALRSVNSASLVELDANESTKHSAVTPSPCIDGLSRSRPAESPVVDVPCGITDDLMLVHKSNQQLVQSDLGKSLCKIIELIEGIKPYSSSGTSESLSRKDGSLLPYKSTETHSGYMVRVLQWKVSELSAVLQQFSHSCYDLLSGKSNVTMFAQELSAALDWIVNHCFSLQDVSSMKDAIKKHYDWDECRSEYEAEVGTINQFSEVDKPCLSHEQLFCLPMVAASYGHCNNFRRDELQGSSDDNKKLKDDLINLKSTKKDLEGRLQSAIGKSESLTNQLRESERTIEGLKKELETLGGSKPDQIENHKSMKEDLDTQLMVAKAELSDTHQKFSCLEVELENRNSYCEELEATCPDLQLRLESVKEAIPVNGLHQEDKQLRTDWEITAASQKLAECQETILNLGKQLKALTSSTEIKHEVISNPNDTDGTSATLSTNAATTSTTTASTSSIDSSASENKIMIQRSSLLDRMMAEDNAEEKDTKSTKTKENGKYPSSAFDSNEVIDHLEKILMLDGNKSENSNGAIRSLAIVPSKRRGGRSLWRKLLWRKKSGSKKPALPFAP